MEKLPSSATPTTVLLLAGTAMMMMMMMMAVAVNAQICVDEYGQCNERTAPDCPTFCTTRHAGGYGSCDASSNTCRCFYPCSGRGGSLCTDVAGPSAQSRCSVVECDTTCQAKFPGSDQDAHGLCLAGDNPNLSCNCVHFCS